MIMIMMMMMMMIMIMIMIIIIIIIVCSVKCIKLFVKTISVLKTRPTSLTLKFS